MLLATVTIFLIIINSIRKYKNGKVIFAYFMKIMSANFYKNQRDEFPLIMEFSISDVLPLSLHPFIIIIIVEIV